MHSEIETLTTNHFICVLNTSNYILLNKKAKAKKTKQSTKNIFKDNCGKKIYILVKLSVITNFFPHAPIMQILTQLYLST